MQHRFPYVAALGGALAASPAFAAPVPLPLEPLTIPFVPSPFRLDVDGKLEFLDVERFDSSSPYQSPQGKLRLQITAELAGHLRWVTGLTGTAGGTPRNADEAGVYDFQQVLQDLSQSLEIGEAYLAAQSSIVDLHVGLQKFAWGKLDAAQPNDLLNPQKFYDPLLEEEGDRKIGVPAVALTFYLPQGGSILGQYSRNDEAYVRARYLF